MSRLDISAWIERFIPDRLRDDADATRRARLLIGFAWVSAVLGTIFCILSAVSYRMPALLLVCALATLAALGTPVLLKRSGSLSLATSLMVALFSAAITTASAFAAGGASQSLPWLGAMPLLATTLGGRRTGVIWAVVCMLLGEAVVALGAADLLPVIPVSNRAIHVGNAANVALLITFLLSFGLLYESSRLKMMAALAQAAAALETEREKSRLSERLASLGRMAAGVAHEINNPMTFVSSNLALLKEDLAQGAINEELRREYLEDILPATDEGIRRVISIVGDLRRFARGDAEQRSEFDLNEEVRTALRMCEAALQDRHLTVKFGALPRMAGNPREVAQVTSNLLLNAAQAVRRGGRILVETESAGDQLILRVSDDGVGMTEAVKARVFEPFFTTKPEGQGTGLGLAVVHGIVRAHGGSVRVESEPGKGSRFEVRFPAARSAEANPSDEPVEN